jgi:uncharacterized damage-inducible protein DinB
MHIADLQRLHEYGSYANQKLLAVVATLSPEQFTRDMGGSYGSVRNTLVHVVSADLGWIERAGGPARGPKLEAAEYSTPAAVLTVFERAEKTGRAFLATLKDEDLSRSIDVPFGGPPPKRIALGDALQHAAIHAVHHRGQTAMILRMLGVVPGNFDYLFFAM